jgi:hypothetical protein
MQIVLALVFTAVAAGLASEVPVHVIIRNDVGFEIAYILNNKKIEMSPGDFRSFVSDDDQFTISFDSDPGPGFQNQAYRLGHDRGGYNFFRKGNRIELGWDQKGTPISLQKQPIFSPGNDSFGAKYATSSATLYPNGYLTIKANTENLDPLHRFRCHVYVVFIDGQGNKIHSTSPFVCSTRRSFAPDWEGSGLDTSGTDSFDAVISKNIVADTVRIDVKHFEKELSKSFFDNAKIVLDTVKKLDKYKEEATAIALLMGGYGDGQANWEADEEKKTPSLSENVEAPVAN